MTPNETKCVNIRVERDALGELALEATCPWGVHTQRALDAFSGSGRTLGGYPAYVRALLLVKRAAAAANAAAGVLDVARAAAIEAACCELASSSHATWPVDPALGGGSIGVNMNVNEVVARRASEGGVEVDPHRHVNASQSTADVCHTACRLAVLEEWDRTAEALGELRAAFQGRAAMFRHVETRARTCLRDACPVTYGATFGAWAAAIERHIDRGAVAVDALATVNLGGTIIGSGVGAPPEYRARVVGELARLAGRPLRLRRDLYDGAQNADDLGRLLAECGLVARTLLKLAGDVRLLASGPHGGFGELVLAPAMEGSSFFRGKLNPIVEESVMQVALR
ncbi:MAG: lyase family protein, partial [Polyangiaceae bacterium]|nr:lyase family protein [Polyangiaceae bacterium]